MKFISIHSEVSDEPIDDSGLDLPSGDDAY